MLIIFRIRKFSKVLIKHLLVAFFEELTFLFLFRRITYLSIIIVLRLYNTSFELVVFKGLLA